jgi:hypothetical protein
MRNMQESEPLVMSNQSIALNAMVLKSEIKNIVSNIVIPDIDPLATAKAKAIAFNNPHELRDTKVIIENLIDLYSIISPRWDAYKQHIAWQNTAIEGSNHPVFMDNERHGTAVAR